MGAVSQAGGCSLPLGLLWCCWVGGASGPEHAVCKMILGAMGVQPSLDLDLSRRPVLVARCIRRVTHTLVRATRAHHSPVTRPLQVASRWTKNDTVQCKRRTEKLKNSILDRSTGEIHLFLSRRVANLTLPGDDDPDRALFSDMFRESWTTWSERASSKSQRG